MFTTAQEKIKRPAGSTAGRPFLLLWWGEMVTHVFLFCPFTVRMEKRLKVY
jgi:hypothetical protein